MNVVVPTETPRAYAEHLLRRSVELTQADALTSYRCLVNCVEMDPTYVPGWMHLGNRLRDMGNTAAAVTAWRAGLRVVGDDVATRHGFLLNIGSALMTMGRLEESENTTDEAIRLWGRRKAPIEPRLAAYALMNRALVYQLRGMDGAALTEAVRGFELFSDPKTELALAFSYLFNGRLADGLKHFDSRFEERLPQYINLPWNRWDGDRLDGALVVLPDMGLGDTLSFARFVAPTAALVDELIFVVQPELQRLLTEALAYVPNVKVVPSNYELPRAAVWCPVFGLPSALGLSTEEIHNATWPGVRPAPVENDTWKNPDARLHVAIAWAGAPGNDIDRYRSIPVTEFYPLHGVDGIQLYSVQVGPRVKDLHETGGVAFIKDMAPWIRDAGDTAGILDQMDLVIACESFVGHLAGAMGKECWLLCSKLGRDWRSPPRLGSQTVWYPDTQVYRQGEDRAWEPVMRRVLEALRART